jgi:hypothetical protein
MGTNRKSSWISEKAATAPKRTFEDYQLLAGFGTKPTFTKRLNKK